MTITNITADATTEQQVAAVAAATEDLEWLKDIDEGTETDCLKAVIFSILHAYGITHIIADFEGSGDSGQIDRLTFCGLRPGAEYDPEVRPRPFEKEGPYTFNVDFPEDLTLIWNGRAPTLKSLVYDLLYDCLEASGVDWYNDDGGSGEFYCRIREGVIELSMGVRIVEVVDHEFTF